LTPGIPLSKKLDNKKWIIKRTYEKIKENDSPNNLQKI
jgi:hypothetical protein